MLIQSPANERDILAYDRYHDIREPRYLSRCLLEYETIAAVSYTQSRWECMADVKEDFIAHLAPDPTV